MNQPTSQPDSTKSEKSANDPGSLIAEIVIDLLIVLVPTAIITALIIANAGTFAGIIGGATCVMVFGTFAYIRLRNGLYARRTAIKKRDTEQMRPDAEYDERFGRLPRKGDAFQNTIDSISGANADRNAIAQAEHDRAIAVLQATRRKRALCERLRQCRIHLETHEIDMLAHRHQPPDCTAGDLHEHILAKLNIYCPQCKYYLRGLPAVGDCPECGARYSTGMIEWEDFCRIICQGTPIDPTGVQLRTSLMTLFNLEAGPAPLTPSTPGTPPNRSPDATAAPPPLPSSNQPANQPSVNDSDGDDDYTPIDLSED